MSCSQYSSPWAATLQESNPFPPPGDLRWERQLQCKVTAFWDTGKITLEDPEVINIKVFISRAEAGAADLHSRAWQQWGKASWWFPDHWRQSQVQSRGGTSPWICPVFSDWQPNVIKRLPQGVLSLLCTNTLINETLAAHIISPLLLLEHTLCLELSYQGQGCAFVKYPGI